MSKFHDNTSMYVDTVINFAKYHIHTDTYILHTTYRMSDHTVAYCTQFRRDKKTMEHLVVFSNSIPYEEETNMAVASMMTCKICSI